LEHVLGVFLEDTSPDRVPTQQALEVIVSLGALVMDWLPSVASSIMLVCIRPHTMNKKIIKRENVRPRGNVELALSSDLFFLLV
jgi:hypothetical protein